MIFLLLFKNSVVAKFYLNCLSELMIQGVSKMVGQNLGTVRTCPIMKKK